ncbi:flagellar basal-body rod protein FlgG [Acidaminobacter hydrogenoformans DSM 2784]|uniref:Flagellar basal-body rod protein FlgG n=2 Tax=Acidaminobacter TaxID=65402 RepID=A0A1G5RUI3_9FIRM|nr:flagellar basal-body rod protein FlgG [Acidaminobacter hydrogenoformans DSM 2784]
MLSQQSRLNRISGNLANVETAGYKRSQVSFSAEVRMAMQSDSVAVAEVPEDRLRGGGGVRALRDFTDLKQGMLTASPDFFDFAIEGTGFFGVRDEAGELFLTRQGGFSLQEDGRLVDASGRIAELALKPGASLTPETLKLEQLTLSGTGELMEMDPSTGKTRTLGQLILYDASNHAQGLISAGESSFRPLDEGALYTNLEQPGAFGAVKASSLERSNVNLLEEMTQLLMTQRAYQLSAKSVSSGDEMMQMVNEIL